MRPRPPPPHKLLLLILLVLGNLSNSVKLVRACGIVSTVLPLCLHPCMPNICASFWTSVKCAWSFLPACYCVSQLELNMMFECCSYVPSGVDSLYLEIFDEVRGDECSVMRRNPRFHLQGVLFICERCESWLLPQNHPPRFFSPPPLPASIHHGRAGSLGTHPYSRACLLWWDSRWMVLTEWQTRRGEGRHD